MVKVKERDITVGIDYSPATSSELVLAEKILERPAYQDTFAKIQNFIVPIAIIILICVFLVFMWRPGSSNAAELDNNTVLTDLQYQVSSCSDSLINCNNKILNYSNTIRDCSGDSSCRSELSVAQSSLSSIQSQLDVCNSGLNILNLDYTALNLSYVDCSSNLLNQTVLQYQLEIFNSSLILALSNASNLSTNITFLNSSWYNCSWALNNTNSSNSSLVACNSSYSSANQTIVNLNSNLSAMNLSLIQSRILNDYLLKNVTCLYCGQQNLTRYFWNETSKELFCTDILWMTNAVMC